METEHPDYVKKFDIVQEIRFGNSPSSISKKLSSPIILLFMLCSFSASSQSTIEGKWYEEGKGAVVLVYEKEGQYFGQLISVESDEDNKKIEDRVILLLNNFEKKSEDKFCCGTVCLPKRKMELTAELILLDDSTLEIKGKYGVLSKSKIWKKLE
jgi:hypothetical protein